CLFSRIGKHLSNRAPSRLSERASCLNWQAQAACQRPPKRHDRQIPAPLPFDWINAHWLVSLESSEALRVDGVNAVSTNALVPLGSMWIVVHQAARPGANVLTAADALQT